MINYIIESHPDRKFIPRQDISTVKGEILIVILVDEPKLGKTEQFYQLMKDNDKLYSDIIQ